MAVPARKTSKSRSRRRRAVNMRVKAPSVVECGTCGNRVLLHRVCPKCGHYREKPVLETAEIA